MAEIGADGGWTASARGWVELVDAGEPHRELLLDPVMLEMCGDAAGLRVLDLGCGEGRFCRLLAGRGALIVGIDTIAELTSLAQIRHGEGAYVRSTAEALPFRAGSFDLAVSYVSMVDIPDYRGAIAEAARVLRPGGRFVIANLTFITASEGWQRGPQGNRLYHRVDRYLEERQIVIESASGVHIRIRNWHRPLSAYMEAYLDAGFILRRFLEPVPEDQSLRDNPEYEDWFRVPTFDVMLWQKPA